MDAPMVVRPWAFDEHAVNAGITAETLGNTLLTQFSSETFVRKTVPFTSTAQAEELVASLDELSD